MRGNRGDDEDDKDDTAALRPSCVPGDGPDSGTLAGRCVCVCVCVHAHNNDSDAASLIPPPTRPHYPYPP